MQRIHGLVLGSIMALGICPPTAEARTAGPSIRLAGHVLEALRSARLDPGARRDPSSEPITLSILLRRSDPEGFRTFLRDVYDPRSPGFHHFLTPRELSDRFGPTPQGYAEVQDYFGRHGFTPVQTSTSRLTLTLRGTRSQAETALAVHIGDYALGSRRFYANDTDPALPPELASKVEAIAGLSDLGRPIEKGSNYQVAAWLFCLSMLAGCLGLLFSGVGTAYAWIPGVIVLECILALLITGGGRGSAQSPSRLADPYNRPVARLAGPGVPDGTGQTIGLVEFDTFHTSDVADFLALFGLPASRIDRLSRVSVAGGVAVPGSGEAEALLDVDTVLNLAPGAQIVAYEAPLSTPWQSMFSAMLDGGVTVIANSWSSCEDQHSDADLMGIDAVLQTAAAAGVGVFNAAGDSGSACLDGSPDTVGVPAGSPHATAVGGTRLTPGAGFTYGAEAWWAGKGGFGVSRLYARPDYQAASTGSPTRSVPDVAMMADPSNGLPICQASAGGCPSGLLYGGTSMAAPVWAAYAALLNDASGQSLGLLNPAVYPLASTEAFHTPASMNSDFAHVGLGSPNLDALARRLSSQAPGAVDAASSELFLATAKVGSTELPLIFEVPADGATAANVCVILRDANGHTVSGKSVALAASPGDAVVINPANGVTSEANGAVVFQVRSLTPASVLLTATDVTDGLDLPATAVLNFAVPPASGGGIEAFPASVPPDGATPSTLTITLRDALGRPAPGKRISVDQGAGHSILTGSSPQVTDPNGQLQFTITNTVAEAVEFTARDETDRLDIPGSARVSFDGAAVSCVGDRPAAAPGFTLTPFANGFLARSFYYSNVNWGCAGASNPAFGTDGSVYVAQFPDGALFRLPSGGGAATSASRLGVLGPTLSQPIFDRAGRLYATHGATGGGFTTGDIVQLDPATGSVLRTVASNLTCPTLAIDPLSSDLFFNDTCFGAGSDNPSIWRVRDPASGTPVIEVYATLPGTPAGAMSFAPDGTLYANYAYTSATPGLVRITGTDRPAPPVVTPITDVQTDYWVRVAEANPDGSAKSLLVNDSLTLKLVDVTAEPPTETVLATGGLSSGTTGPDGCLYVNGGDAVYKIAPNSGGCGLLPSNPGPALALSPSSVAPDPPTGQELTFTASLLNAEAPEGTPVRFQITGANPQLKLARTDSTGHATLRYAGYFAGADTITATATLGSEPATLELASNAASVSWRTNPLPGLGLGWGAALGLGALLMLGASRLRRRFLLSCMRT